MASFLPASGPSAGTLSASVASGTQIDLAFTGASGGTSPYSYAYNRSANSDMSSATTVQTHTGQTGADTYNNTVTTRTAYYYQAVVTDADSNTDSSNIVGPIWAATATIYYVANGGDDSHDGTEETHTSGSTGPWQTCRKVSAWPQWPGDIYSFNGGDTFTGQLAVTSSGTQAAPITVTSYGTGKATITCPDNSGGNYYNGILCQNVEFVTVENVITTGSGVGSDGSTTSGNAPFATYGNGCGFSFTLLALQETLFADAGSRIAPSPVVRMGSFLQHPGHPAARDQIMLDMLISASRDARFMTSNAEESKPLGEGARF